MTEGRDGMTSPRRARFRRRVVFAAIHLLVISTLTACERPDPVEQAKRRTVQPARIVVIGPHIGDPAWTALRSGAENAAGRFPNVEIEFVQPADATEPALGEASDAALARDPRAVCVFSASPDLARATVERIVARGVIVVTIGTNVPLTGVFGHVDASISAGAELLGQNLESIARGGRSYVLVHRNGQHTTATNCYNRFMLAARLQFGMSLLDELNSFKEKRPIEELVRQAIDQYQNAALVVTFDPEPWADASLEESLGPATRFATLSGAPALWSAVRANRAAALAGILDGQLGSLAVELAMEGVTNTRALSGAVRVVERELITRENLDGFVERYAQAAGMSAAELERRSRESPRPGGSPPAGGPAATAPARGPAGGE